VVYFITFIVLVFAYIAYGCRNPVPANKRPTPAEIEAQKARKKVKVQESFDEMMYEKDQKKAKLAQKKAKIAAWKAKQNT